MPQTIPTIPMPTQEINTTEQEEVRSITTSRGTLEQLVVRLQFITKLLPLNKYDYILKMH